MGATGCLDLCSQADALFGGMPDGVLIQQDGRILYANRRLASMVGVDDPLRLVGTVALELYPDSEYASAVARIQSAYFGRSTPVDRHRIRAAGGETAIVEVSCLVLRLADAPILIEILRACG
jgi:PAS domain S-box-containing protein